MIQKLKKIFASAPVSEPENAFEPTELACACLLTHAALQDGTLEPQEQEAMARLLGQRFKLDNVKAEALLETARGHVAQSVEMYGITRDIKDALAHDERLGLMEMLWQVVYADGELHDYEANLMRRIAGLIYISDRESGEARKRALRALGILE